MTFLDKLELVCPAVGHHALSIEYVDVKGAETKREIVPFWVVEAKYGTYIHVLCYERRERRTFRIDRIQSVAVSERSKIDWQGIGSFHHLDIEPMGIVLAGWQ